MTRDPVREERAIHPHAPHGLRRLVVLSVAVCIALTTAGAASAHATLVATTPGNGASLDRAPARVALRFDEPVETVSGAVRVFDATGAPVTVGAARQLTDLEVAADLPDDLGPGTYTVAWRVVSADSHPIRGAFVFAVGRPVGDVAVVVEKALAAERDLRRPRRRTGDRPLRGPRPRPALSRRAGAPGLRAARAARLPHLLARRPRRLARSRSRNGRLDGRHRR